MHPRVECRSRSSDARVSKAAAARASPDAAAASASLDAAAARANSDTAALSPSRALSMGGLTPTATQGRLAAQADRCSAYVTASAKGTEHSPHSAVAAAVHARVAPSRDQRRGRSHDLGTHALARPRSACAAARSAASHGMAPARTLIDIGTPTRTPTRDRDPRGGGAAIRRRRDVR